MNMRLLIIFIFTCSAAVGQTKSELLKQLNRDVWLPFIQGVNANQPEVYNSMLASDFYWVAGGNKTRIMNAKDYIEDARLVMNDRQKKNIGTNLEVRFLERHVNENFAAEKCIIKYTSIPPDQQPSTSYGIMQVFSKLDQGRWKKYIQYIATEPCSAEQYDKAIPLE